VSYATALVPHQPLAGLEQVASGSGESGYLGTLLKTWLEAKLHLDTAITRQSIAGQFYELADTWRAESALSSSISEMVQHPAYLRIIGLGPRVLPLLLRDVEQRQEHWYPALSAITGANPVRPQDRGRIDAMADAWITWAKEQGYSW